MSIFANGTIKTKEIMCLRLTSYEKKIAQEDIECYKVLKVSGGLLLSPFQMFDYMIGKFYETKLGEIEEGDIYEGFHSCSTIYGARRYQTNNVEHIFKCIIPKGAQLFVGRHDEFEGYASNQIIIKEVMELEDVFPFFNAKIYPYRRGQKIKVSFGGKGTRLCTITNIVPKEEDLIQIKSGIFAFCTDKHGKSLDCEIDILDFL